VQDTGTVQDVAVDLLEDQILPDQAGVDCSSGVTHAWSKGFGGIYLDNGTSVVADSNNGTVYVTGVFQDTVDFGGGTIPGSGYDDIFIASFTSSGVHRWSKALGGDGYDRGADLAVDAAGNIYMTGRLQGSADFGGGTISASDIFVASFNADGAHRWSKGFGSGTGEGRSVAVDSSGNIYVTGFRRGTVDFGGGSTSGSGYDDIFVASFTSDGDHRWSKVFAAVGEDKGESIAVDNSGNVFVTGSFFQTVDLGGGVVAGKGGLDIFVASFTSSGAHRWSNGFGGTSHDQGTDVAVDRSGNVYVTGHFEDSVQFGGEKLIGGGSLDIFVASFDSTGLHRWSKSFGSFALEFGKSVAVDGSGNVYVTGGFVSATDFGCDAIKSNGAIDVFVVSLTSLGDHRWSMGCGSAWDFDLGIGLALDKHQDVYVTGSFSLGADFGGGPLNFVGDRDIFLLKLSQK